METVYLNYLLGFLAILLVVRRFFLTEEPTVQSNPLAQPEPLLFQTYTPQTLAKYNGNDDPRVLLAVKGKVFDVTAGKKFYGPGGPYENFAGHDASRGLAKNSFDDEMITAIDQPIDKLEDLTGEEQQSLDQWFEHFQGKYTVCGELVDNDKHK